MGSLGVGVAGQVLDVLEGHVLGKQVGHHEDAEAVGAEDIGQPGIFEPSFEHTAHGVGRQGQQRRASSVFPGRTGIENCSIYPQTRRFLMATPAEPATDALYQALSSPELAPQVVHAAIEEIRYLSDHNVIAAIGAQITELKAELPASSPSNRALTTCDR